MTRRVRLAITALATGVLATGLAITGIASATSDPSGERTTAQKSSASSLPTCTGYLTRKHPGHPGYHYRIPFRPGHGSQCKLQLGDYNNKAVEMLQWSLLWCNNARVSTDGDYGPITRNAIAYIQGARGIEVDGVYGPQTRNVLRWLLWQDPVAGQPSTTIHFCAYY